MGAESPNRGAAQSGAVFLSYASQDAEAAQKICDALRSAGVDVWFDQSELRGGDAWDRQIRERIHDCRLFIALISAHTEARDEGYFRHEWKLAVERTHHMSDKKPFLVPVVIDDTRERGASVPDKLHEVQWTRLPGGETPPEFLERVRRLVSPEPQNAPTATVFTAGAAPAAPQAMREPVPASRQSKWTLPAIAAAVVAGAVLYFAIDRFWISKHPTQQPTAPAAQASAAPTAFSPPPHSIAVLPFVNMSGDKEQEYFSDGLTEEILNSLARINELQVSARTSSFLFKGEKVDLGTIARKLNVGAILEGSVRHSGNTVRVTAQLNNAVTGFHLWSQTYDRDLGYVLKLQTEIATAVASALKVSLLGDVAAKVELGGTRIPAAFDAYLRGLSAERAHPDDMQAAIDAQTEAIRLDSKYALAFAARSFALTRYADVFAPTVALTRDAFDKALADARTAIAVTPELGEGHAALATVLDRGFFDFARAKEEYERAIALVPGNASVLGRYGYFAASMGDADVGVAASRRAVALDRVNADSYERLGDTLFRARHFKDAIGAYNQALALQPGRAVSIGRTGQAYYALGDLQSARSVCESKIDFHTSQVCLAATYDKLGRRADADAMLVRLRAANGDTTLYQYAQIYAQWGNRARALEELEKAVRARDPGLHALKTDFLVDPLRSEPRFQAIERDLKFPD